MRAVIVVSVLMLCICLLASSTASVKWIQSDGVRVKRDRLLTDEVAGVVRSSTIEKPGTSLYFTLKKAPKNDIVAVADSKTAGSSIGFKLTPTGYQVIGTPVTGSFHSQLTGFQILVGSNHVDLRVNGRRVAHVPGDIVGRSAFSISLPSQQELVEVSLTAPNNYFPYSESLSDTSLGNLVNVECNSNDCSSVTPNAKSWNHTAYFPASSSSVMGITFTYDNTGNSTNFAVGVTSAPVVKDYGYIDYGLLFTFENGQNIPKLQLIEAGTVGVSFDNKDWLNENTFSITFVRGSLEISREGNTFYSKETNAELRATAVIFRDAGCRLKSVQINNGIEVTPEPSVATPGVAISMKNIVGLESMRNLPFGSWKKVSGSSGWNAGAISKTPIASENDQLQGISISAPENATGLGLMFGLSTKDESQLYKELKYAIYLTSGRQIQIFESGVKIGTFGTYSPGNEFNIRIVNNRVVYSILGGISFHSSDVVPTYPMNAELLIHDSGLVVHQVKWVAYNNYPGNKPAVLGASPSFNVYTCGVQSYLGMLSRSLNGGEWSAGASSLEKIVKGHQIGGVSFKIAKEGGLGVEFAIGLRSGPNKGPGVTDITWAMILTVEPGARNAKVVIREQGKNGNTITLNNVQHATDLYAVQLNQSDGKVAFSRNGVLIAKTTSAPADSSFPLFVDTSFKRTDFTVQVKFVESSNY